MWQAGMKWGCRESETRGPMLGPRQEALGSYDRVLRRGLVRPTLYFRNLYLEIQYSGHRTLWPECTNLRRTPRTPGRENTGLRTLAFVDLVQQIKHEVEGDLTSRVLGQQFIAL